MLVTAGDPARRTGGNLYNRRMLAALRRDGVRVAAVVLSEGRGAAQLDGLRAPLVLVDTIAAPLAVRHLARLRRRGSEVVTLAHMRLGAVALARRSDRVVAVSRSLSDDLVAGGIDRRRIVVIPPGREVVAASPRGKQGEGILCVANWTRTKGIHTLVAAVGRLPGASLDLVGDAPDPAYAARVRRAIAASGLGTRVRVHGVLGRAALARRYRAAAMFALPSTREAYPIVFAEALAHGLPIIGCDISAVREVTGGAAILVPPGRVAALADALERLLTDEPARRVLARRSLLRARQLPTWAESEERFVRTLRKWTGSDPTQRARARQLGASADETGVRGARAAGKVARAQDDAVVFRHDVLKDHEQDGGGHGEGMAETKAAKKSVKKTAKSTRGTASKGFTAEERAAMKERAQELKAAAGKAEGESTLLAKIAEMPEPDRALAKRLHAVIKASAPDLSPKTWYGMPAYAKDDKVVCFFTPASKFKERYASFGFNAAANLDEGNMWPTAFALTKLTATEEARIGQLVKKAMS